MAQVRVCHTNALDARAEAMDRLRKKAAAMGATGVVEVGVEVGRAAQPYIKNGMANPCAYETRARGEAVVLASDSASQTVAK